MVRKRFLKKAFLKEQEIKSTPTSEHKLSWGTVIGGHIQLPLRVSPLCPMRTLPEGSAHCQPAAAGPLTVMPLYQEHSVVNSQGTVTNHGGDAARKGSGARPTIRYSPRNL